VGEKHTVLALTGVRIVGARPSAREPGLLHEQTSDPGRGRPRDLRVTWCTGDRRVGSHRRSGPGHGANSSACSARGPEPADAPRRWGGVPTLAGGLVKGPHRRR
jgi:hypothetical protein